MMLFYTNSVKHLAEKLKVKKGKFVIKHFLDGESYVKVLENTADKNVWVLASTNSAENILELFFLLDALKREKARIHLFLTYFGYARQDRIEKGEAFSGKIVCDWLRALKLEKIVVLHMHSPRLQQFLRYENVLPFEVCAPLIRNFEVLVAPDLGAVDLVKNISKKYQLLFGCLEKIRKPGKIRMLRFVGNVKDKKVLIVDDMISTGTTILLATEKLKKAGAREVSVLATHGIFAGNALKNLEKSSIKKVYVTNSLPQKKAKKVQAIAIAPFIEKFMK